MPWQQYRNAKWFQLAMEDARDQKAWLDYICPFCRVTAIEIKKVGCGLCVFGPEFFGCQIGKGYVATCQDLWGEEA